MYQDVTNEAILEALYTSPSKAEAARKLNIARSTLYLWLKTPEISEPYEQWRLEAMADCSDSLHSESAGAVVVLRTIAHDANVLPSVRVQAANALITHSLRVRETVELEDRLADLEAQLG